MASTGAMSDCRANKYYPGINVRPASVPSLGTIKCNLWWEVRCRMRWGLLHTLSATVAVTLGGGVGRSNANLRTKAISAAPEPRSLPTKCSILIAPWPGLYMRIPMWRYWSKRDGKIWDLQPGDPKKTRGWLRNQVIPHWDISLCYALESPVYTDGASRHVDPARDTRKGKCTQDRTWLSAPSGLCTSAGASASLRAVYSGRRYAWPPV